MKEIIEKLIKFRNDRNWEQYHTPQELARSLMIEAAELNRIFQWNNWLFDVDKENLKEELADVMIYALYLCERYGIDPTDTILEKIEKNAIKYPK